MWWKGRGSVQPAEEGEMNSEGMDGNATGDAATWKGGYVSLFTWSVVKLLQ